MRIVISDIPNARPLVLENMHACILAADDGADGDAPLVAHGEPKRLAQLAAVILIAVRGKLGDKVFESVVNAARKANGSLTDISASVLK